ncbi:YTH domain-containing protein ECT2-like isoform X1 [Telopea speciosissima]|uniref:YTH domain-containing protein ECT2-like isoform X1 n=1 Tax=Telopea speciosissima TaxID=54955 RepID=UPI001CC51E21|nr:YTH domain-containing protein ECT2-like isoform X1 [Telopea speciosissima]
MAAVQQESDRIISGGDSTESMNVLTLNAEGKPADPNNLKEQSLSTKGERMVPSNPSQDAAPTGAPRFATGQSASLGAARDHSTVYQPNIYAPQAHSFYYGGYDNGTGEWDEYPHYVNAEGLEIGSPGIYRESPSLVFHTGFGYNPQMPYGPYSPVTTPLPSVRGDGQLYSPQQFPFAGQPYYQQPVPPSMPYISSPTPVSQTELTMPVSIDQQGDGMLFGPRPGYPPPFSSFSRGGSFSGNSGSGSFYDLRQGYEGFGSGAPWSDWSKSADGQRSLSPLSSPAASLQPIGSFGSFGYNIGMTSQQQGPLYGFGSGSSSYTRGYPNGGIYQGSSFEGGSLSSLGTNSRSWMAIEKGRRRGRRTGSLCVCNETLDVLDEQNRGPRASKLKSQITAEHGSSVDCGKNNISKVDTHSESYNRPDFVTEYGDAKFFIIKSYSEDNVHKSIKYGVWASTPNGNRKLDAAYCEAKERKGDCPVFLFFSVNASAQFCGVAAMAGPVDFDKSVDYWQQDKWSGQFPVKWHLIKDVPNSQFRHIILENNDNKPVTNSRDTQEVKMEQGIEMLNIFKCYETDMSILDDFDFYEDREKAMLDRKARQQSSLMVTPVAGAHEHRNPVSLSNNFIKQMSKSFAQAVKLDEVCKKDLTTEKNESAVTVSMSMVVKPEDTKTSMTLAASTAQSS